MNQNNTNDYSLLRNMATEFSCIEGNCGFAHIASDLTYIPEQVRNQRHRIEGTVILILVKGKLTAQLDTDEYEMEAPAAVVLHHGSSLQIQCSNEEPVDAYILAFSPQFIQEINISFTAISGEVLISNRGPMLPLEEREVPLLLRYLSLIHTSMTDSLNVQLTKHLVSSLSSALFYQLMQLLYKRVNITGTNAPRRSTYVSDFLKLVQVYFTTERSVSFYASKLLISPKYLSMLVKEATGRSATRWIDHFVITEAKNLLRYSGKNVQQIAYELNFSTQSSFGKYFKTITGMSPTEFQKS